jgi:hypothetical protein
MGAVSNEGPELPAAASQPMSRETADWYISYTRGQFQAFEEADGSWYLYLTGPAEPGDERLGGRP